MLSRSMISVTLENPYTGELSLFSRVSGTFSLSWTLEADGLALRSGRFSLTLQKEEKKALPLSLEIPPTLPGALPMLRIAIENGQNERDDFSFPLPVSSLLPPGKPEPLFTGFRADAASAVFSAGKLAGRAGAAGLQELTWNGIPLLSRPPRLSLLPAAWSPEELPLMKVIPDRFDAGEGFSRSHALVLPRGNEEDELEVTQTFTPLSNGAILMEWHFIVPGSFAPLAHLGVDMELSPGFPELSLLHETDGGGVEKILPEIPFSCKKVSFLSFREKEKGIAGLIVPASTMKISLSSGESGATHLFCGVDAITPLSRGSYRFQLFFHALHAGEEAAPAARKIRLFHP